MIDDRMVEIAAKGICDEHAGSWDETEDWEKASCIDDANAALQALLDAGYTIVPPVEGKVT